MVPLDVQAQLLHKYGLIIMRSWGEEELGRGRREKSQLYFRRRPVDDLECFGFLPK